MKIILKYVKPYWWLVLLAPLFMIGEVLCDLVQIDIMSEIVNKGILNEIYGASEKVQIVIKFGIQMLILLVLGGIGGILSAACASACANSFANDLRKEVFSKVINLSFEQTDKFTTGSLITRITNDITQIQDFVSMAVRMFIRSLTMFIGGMVFMFRINPAFGYVILIVLPIEFITVFYFLKKVNPLFKVVQKKIDKVNSVVQENVNGARVVKAFTGEEKEKNRFDESNTDLANHSYNVFKIMSLLGPIMNIFLYGVCIAIIYIGGIEINKNITLILAGNENVFMVGDVIEATTYVSMILGAVVQLTMISQQVTRATVSANRVREVLDSLPVIVSNNTEVMETEESGTIEFKNVSFSYPNFSSAEVLDDISLKINTGETLAILGATGSGKTTLVNLIPRFYDTSNGDVLVDGVNVKDYALSDLRTRVTTVLQRTELFSGTIYDNIKWGKGDATLDEVKKVCEISQAANFIEEFNNGYDTIIGEKGSSLSGGQKQRLAIARALIRKPEILIFDDSTSALDLETEAKLYKALRENLGDTTVVLIAQRVASAKNADRIAVIDQGKIVACDTHDNLMKNCDIYIDIYNSQLKRGDEDE